MKQPDPMTPQQFRDLIAAAGLKQGKVAELIGRDRRTVVRYLSGAVPIDLVTATAIRRLVRPKRARKK